MACVKTGVEQLDASNVMRSSESRCTKTAEKYVPKALEVPQLTSCWLLLMTEALQ